MTTSETSDPDPWCAEADGEYVPSVAPEILSVQVDVEQGHDRWNDVVKDPPD